VLSKWLLIAISAGLLTGCIGNGLLPSVWPPDNFRLVVEEVQRDGGSAHVIRRLQVIADGTVIYGTSSKPLVDAATGVSWPVFDRLSIYRLEPKCVRALARRIDRLGISDVIVPASAVAQGVGAGPGTVGPGLTVQWQAFGSQRVLPSSGRLRGAMAEIMAVIASHLPPGESFATEMSRPIVPVLRGVPEPKVGAAEALLAFNERMAEDPEDGGLVLAAYALACSAGERRHAETLLQRWLLLERSKPRSPGFSDDAAGGTEARIQSLKSFLPPA
tara:strand:+ start:30786 stop:31607 length:822 start_codon:yes stop_codon:yes gene_type:complete